MLSRTFSATRSRVLTAIALGLVAVIVWTLGIYNVGFSATQTEMDFGTLLLTTNRASLKLCVDSKVPGISNETLKTNIELYLEYVKQHPDFVPSGLAGNASPQVDAGCPGPARITDPGFRYRSGSSDLRGIGVDEPSPYRVYVYVVPQEQITPLADKPFRGVPQEMYCQQPADCAEVARAVYLTPADVSNAGLVARELARAAGLDESRLPAAP